MLKGFKLVSSAQARGGHSVAGQLQVDVKHAVVWVVQQLVLGVEQ